MSKAEKFMQHTAERKYLYTSWSSTPRYIPKTELKQTLVHKRSEQRSSREPEGGYNPRFISALRQSHNGMLPGRKGSATLMRCNGNDLQKLWKYTLTPKNVNTEKVP